jgi:septal ring factor EnvC (AmiA/AmiB activator)
MTLLPENQVDALVKKSSDALGVLQNTMKKLSEVNAQIRAAKTKRLEKIGTLQAEVDTLEQQEEQNNKYHQKLEDFLKID